MQIQGDIIKMRAEYAHPVKYFLSFTETEIPLNDFLGKSIRMEYSKVIHCLGCGAVTVKSFAQGYCYKCLISRPETAGCVLNPEKCTAHLGVARDMDYAEKNCLQDHFVYLALSGDLKVGVTRASQIPTRWIDQGASSAIKLARLPYRALAGEMEVELKQFYKDKTSWQKMLKAEVPLVNLVDAKQLAYEHLSEEKAAYVIDDDEVLEIQYPLLSVPKKVSSLSFDKEGLIEGVLTGIKGQYLILDNERVLNLRKHGGYEILFSA
jgi:hypothetical protein